MKNLHTVKQQRGASLLSIGAIILVLASISFLVAKTAPTYIDFYKVKMAMESMAKQPDYGDKSPAELRRNLYDRLHIDDVHGVERKDMQISRQPDKVVLRVIYERRTEVIDVLDLVGKFDHTVEIPRTP